MRVALGMAGMLAVLAAPVPVGATACVNAKTVRVAIPRGGRCWNYRGDATHFVGSFRAGQRVTVQSFGRADYGNGNSRTEPRSISVEGPGGASADLGEGSGVYRVPATGTYTFVFYPCAMWRLPGTFQLCA